jgi:ubiquitin carboxyl-terminal hydrolase 5/13
MAELELDMNQRTWEWSLLQETGSQLQLVHGPGLTGMHNIGNSCYLNSVMQVLLTIPQFTDRYIPISH